MAEYFQANEFSLPTHSISYSSDRRSDEWNRRDEEERERHGGTVCGVTQRGAALCGRSGRREIAEGELKILKHDLCPRVLNLIHRCPMHLITGSKFQTIRSVCFFTLQWKADDGLYPPIKRNTLTRSACFPRIHTEKFICPHACRRYTFYTSLGISAFQIFFAKSWNASGARKSIEVAFVAYDTGWNPGLIDARSRGFVWRKLMKLPVSSFISTFFWTPREILRSYILR